MHYQSDGTQVAARPAPAAVTGVPGYVSPGNPFTGAVPTNDDPDLMNAIMDELCGVVQAAGLVLDKANNTQLINAIRILARGSTQFLAGSQILTIPSWASAADVELWGGGGAGGGSTGTGSTGGGGGGGGYLRCIVKNLVGNATVAATLGAGGVGGLGGNPGATGNATSFGPYATATGGAGGGAGISGPGVGGNAGGGALSAGVDGYVLGGGVGGSGYAIPSGVIAGVGGLTFAGGYGFAPVGSPSAPVNGFNQPIPGQGGTGGLGGGAGANGTAGFMIVRWLP